MSAYAACQKWYDQGAREPQEVCVCGHFAASHSFDICLRCEGFDLERDMTMRERIEALPCEGATRSRDYGRGYAQAMRDVMRLMHAHDRSWLEGPCSCDPATVDAQNLRTPLTANGEEDAS